MSARPESFGRYTLANPAYCRIVGYDAAALRALHFADIVHADDFAPIMESLALLTSGGAAAIDAELRLRRRDGVAIWVRQHRSIIRSDAGEPLLFLSHTEDISQQKREQQVAVSARRVAEDALRESETRYRLLAEHAADMIVQTRADRTRAYVSPASKTLLGYEPHEIMETDFATFLHPEDREWVAAAYDRFLVRGGACTHIYRLRHRNGTYVWVEAHWVATRTATSDLGADAASAVISVVRDISERKAAEAQIALLACHDPLSGLANRVLFRERLGEALERVHRGGTAAVVSIDLDDFKGVNDTYGHAVGDALLRAVAERVRACVGPADTVARLGGDEFAVVVLEPDTPAAAAAKGRRIVEALNVPYDLDGRQVAISASVGVTSAPQDGTDLDTLLKNADMALYRAKAEGRNTCRRFEPEMVLRVRAKRTMELELRQALLDGTFTAFYQPMISLNANALAGFEALIRWRHPQRGLVSPCDFIPLAEETGLIVQIGEYVLRAACREAATWPQDVRLSVNLSPIQFRTGNLVATVLDALHESGLAAHRLDLEITESVLLQDNEKTLATLHDLRARGVGISLDDFGTGYSSLCYIRTFRFDKIKIDRSFVADMLRSPESGAIVRAVIGLGETLGISTVAEGVETREQLQQLRADGCTEAQGYLFSKPRPGEHVPAFIDAFERDRLASGGRS
ncbi:MAG: hypothetical protein NVS3B16_19190 [Vulcanimicrobiaceae bacterium]